MRINHNLTAINTHRQMGISELDGSKSMEKLSSGFRINRAGDDAAGLAISEKMRGQVRGLAMASKNSSDTISLIQTAEGALAETHSILQRMRELAVQSANDTNVDKDREELQAEVKQLKAEIDRIGNTTEFNTKKLLEGSATGVRAEIEGTLRVNNNSDLVIDANKQKAMADSIANDKSWAFDGAYMLIKTNQTFDANGKAEYNATDYNLVGPDGKVFNFKSYSAGTVFTVDELKEGTIIAGGPSIEVTGDGAVLKNNVTIGNDTALNAFQKPTGVFTPSSTDGDIEMLAKGSILAKDSTINFNNNAPTPSSADDRSIKIEVKGKEIDIEWDAKNGLLKVNDELVAVGKSITLEDGTVLSHEHAGEITVSTGRIKMAQDLTANVGSNAAGNVVDFSLAKDSTLVAGTVLQGKYTPGVAAGTKNIDITTATNQDYTLGAALASTDVTKLGAGTTFAATSTITIATSGQITIGGKTLYSDGSDLWEDSTMSTQFTGGILGGATVTVTTNVITVSAGQTMNVGAMNTIPTGVTFNMAAGSVIGTGTLGTSTTVSVVTPATAAKTTVTFEAGTVITAGDPDKVFTGSVTLADGGINIQFSANGGNALDGRYYDLGVGDGLTYIFTAYDAASSNLNDSIMSQIGANSGQTTFLSINDMRARALGVADVDISSKWGAATAIETVNNALQKVSHQRSLLGALQNRLEHTIKNLDTAAENLQAAESRIRDVDMAKEVMEFTRTNILQQAAQSMLAQANQQPQSVLQLLR